MADQTMVENPIPQDTKDVYPKEHTQRVKLLKSWVEHRVLATYPDSTLAALDEGVISLSSRDKANLLYEDLMAYSVTDRIIKEERRQNPEVEPEPVAPYLINEIHALWQDPQVQDLFTSRFAEARIEAKLYRESEMGRDWKKINKDLADTREVFESQTRKLFLQQVTRPDYVKEARGLAEEKANKIIALQKRKQQIVTLEGLPRTAENTDIAANIMHETLSKYHDELNQGFVWLPSRLSIHVSTLQSLQNARWPVLRGEAGTGKSEQADAAALVLTGEQPTHLAASEKTGERQLIADKEIDPVSGGSYEQYGPAMQAATGYEDSRQSEPTFKTGRMVRIDESGRLGKDGYSTMKELRQKKPTTPQDIRSFKEGKTIDPDKLLHGKPVLPGFAAILATNPEGSRYPDRTEPDAALRRELSYVVVDYPDMGPTNPELYEFMLAALMDDNHHITTSREELAPAYTLVARNDKLPDGRRIQAEQQLIINEDAPQHGALYRLSHAIRALQDSFIAGNQGVPSDEPLHFEPQADGSIKIVEIGGEPLTLSNTTITLGEISSWMRGFRDRRLKDDPNYQVGTLTEWIQLKLKTYLNQVDEIDKDKIEAIFNYFHLFDPAPDLTNARPITPKEIGYLSPRVPKPLHLDLSDQRGEATPEPPMVSTPDLHTDISGLLEDSSPILIKPGTIDFERNGRTISLRNGSLVTLSGEKFRFAGFSPDGKPVVRLANEDLYRVVDLEQLKMQGEFNFVLQEAEALFGQDFLGPEQIEKAFGIKVDDVPDIQFSLDELRQAKGRGEMLVLYTDKAPDGQPLTMEKMLSLLKPQFDRDGKGGVLYNTEWCKDQDFFKKEAPKVKWGLAGKDFIPNSTNKNYLQQTEALADFVKNTVFKGQPIPPEYQEALREFEKQKGDIGKLLGSNWDEAGKRLAALKLTQMTRTSPVEDAYRLLAYFQNNNDRLLPVTVNWTQRRTSRGDFVSLGSFVSLGVLVDYWNPDDQNPVIGVCFSR